MIFRLICNIMFTTLQNKSCELDYTTLIQKYILLLNLKLFLRDINMQTNYYAYYCTAIVISVICGFVLK